MMTEQQRKAFQRAVDVICAQNSPVTGVGYARAVGVLKSHLEMVADGHETPERAIQAIIERALLEAA